MERNADGSLLIEWPDKTSMVLWESEIIGVDRETAQHLELANRV